MGRHLTVGCPVVVSFDPHDICVVDDMRQFNGFETTISKVYTSKTHMGRQFSYQYELDGVVSTVGQMPYTLTRDMITDAEEAINAND